MERDTLQLKKKETVSFAPLEPDWTDGSQRATLTLWEEHTNKKVNSSSLKDVQQNSSIPIFSTLLKKRQLYHEKKRKILKKVCEMSKYLTLIPLLREMCFPYYHSCLEKKMTMVLGNWNFYVFSFGNWANVIWVLNIKTTRSPFPRENSSSPFIPSSIRHPHPSIPFSLYGRLYVPAPCGESRLYSSSMCFFFLFCLFYIYSCLYGWRRDGSHFIWRALSIHPPATFVWFLSFFPFQAYSSQYLPVLSKCYCKVFQWDDSKYVYINRGNTLGYILLTPCVAWSLYHLLFLILIQWRMQRIWTVLKTLIFLINVRRSAWKSAKKKKSLLMISTPEHTWESSVSEVFLSI